MSQLLGRTLLFATITIITVSCTKGEEESVAPLWALELAEAAVCGELSLVANWERGTVYEAYDFEHEFAGFGYFLVSWVEGESKVSVKKMPDAGKAAV